MASLTDIIVLNTTKLGETSLVLHCLSREYGRRGFIVNVGKKMHSSLLQPLNILEAKVVENPKSTLWRAVSLTPKYPLNGLRQDIRKGAISLFMSEVLYRTIKDGTDEDGLFEWCVGDILTLDAMESDFSNYHLRFLLEFAVVLGFSPSAEDLRPFCGEMLDDVELLLRSSFSESMLVPLNGERRNAIAESIVRYISHHSESAINLRSLSVLRELFV